MADTSDCAKSKENEQLTAKDLIKYEEELAANNSDKPVQPVSFWSMSQPASATGIHTNKYPSSVMVVNTELTSSVFDKRPRLPFLILFNNNDDQDENRLQASMPAVGAEALEKPRVSEELAANRPGQSLPVDALTQLDRHDHSSRVSTIPELEPAVEMGLTNSNSCTNSIEHNEPSPMNVQSIEEEQQQQQQQQSTENGNDTFNELSQTIPTLLNQSSTTTNKSLSGHQTYSSIGDSLIDLIIKLREENTVLAQAIGANNRYVKERLVEAKEIHELAQTNERQFAIERREYQAQISKLQRQNTFLSERLKNLEAAKKRGQQSEQQQAASSSGTDSGDALLSAAMDRIYPILDHHDSFSNACYTRGSTSSNISSLNAEGDGGLDTIQECQSTVNDDDQMTTVDYDGHRVQPTAPPMSVSSSHYHHHQSTDIAYPKVSLITKPQAATQTSLEDPMKQCDKLEQRLNDIGKKDCEITQLQNRLNMYRRDYGFEPIEKLEAQLQIEKLRNDIDRLCLKRLQEQQQGNNNKSSPTTSSGSGSESDNNGASSSAMTHGRHRRGSHKLRRHHRHHRHHYDETASGATASATTSSAGSPSVIGKLGNHLGKKALKHAAKAAKKAQIHAAKMESEHDNAMKDQHYSSRRRSNPGSDMVNGLFSSANKAVLTGYKIASNVASNHVNLALERLNQQYDQTNASQQQAANKQ